MIRAMAARPAIAPQRIFKPPLFALLAWPAVAYAWDYAQGELFSPWRTLLHDSGLWAMRFIVLGLAVTPLRIVTGLGWIQTTRRMVGLFAAFYTALHVFAWCRQYGYDWEFLVGEIVARFYLLVGLVATLLMVPLTVTSTAASMRALGGARWRRLHRLVFPTALLAWWHDLLSRGVPPREVYIHAGLLALLLAVRMIAAWRRPVAGAMVAARGDER